MSITLDVNNFLKNVTTCNGVDGASGTGVAAANHAATLAHSKLDAMLQNELAIAELPKDGTNIFDEIENLLKSNKFIENSHDALYLQSQALNEQQPQPSATMTQPILVSSPNLEFAEFVLPNCISSSEYLVPEETHNFNSYQELDPQLFSVEDGELQPITSPFMVPGIYKKFSNALSDSVAVAPESTGDKNNVYLSNDEQSGRIVSVDQFHELYVCADKNGQRPLELANASQRQVLLLEDLEDEREEFGAMPALAVKSTATGTIPKQWDALSKLAYDILKLSNRDQIVIDRKQNEIIRIDSATKQKTIYRFLAPENFNLTPRTKKVVCQPKPQAVATEEAPRKQAKLGRPRKRPADDASAVSNKKNSPKHKKRLVKTETAAATEQNIVKPEPSTLRTRFGRLVRTRIPPTTISKELNEDNADDPADDAEDFIKKFLADLKDHDFQCNQPISPIALSSAPPSPTLTKITSSKNTQTKRKVQPESICPTCNKIFLGRRLQRHFGQHPDHMQAAPTKEPPSPNSQQLPLLSPPPNADVTLFRYLVSKLQKSHLNEDQRADLFLNEINDLVKQLQLRSSRLIRNTSGSHFITSRCSRVLGIPEGQYALDMTAIGNEAPPHIEPEAATSCMLNFEHLSSSALPAPMTHARSLEYTTLSMSMDDTLTDEAAQKLNLSAGGKLLPPSEESLLRTVKDLVHDGIQKLNESAANLLHPPAPMAAPTPVLHYDHASDNAVEAVSMKETAAVQQTQPMLGLPVDFFQFNND